jgi:hypothetical protein
MFTGNALTIDLSGPFESISQSILSLWPLVVGVLLQATAEACTALRDLARNSFH